MGLADALPYLNSNSVYIGGKVSSDRYRFFSKNAEKITQI